MHQTMRSDPLEVPQGVDWAIAWPVVYDDDQTPVADLTGYAAQAQARPRAASPVVLHQWDSASGGIDLRDGHVILRVTAQESALWTFEHAVYDILMRTPTSQTYPVAGGGLLVLRTVTRWRNQ